MIYKVSEAALIARLNRRLAHDDQRIKTCRCDSRSFPTLGRYYIHRFDYSVVADVDIDLEAWGRELGVLRDNEALAD
jgi:hypothetical protein